MDNKIREQIDLINQKTKELNSLYRLAAYKSSISDGEVDIWSALLNTNEEYSQQDLAEMLSLPKQTVNSLVTRMIHKEFVVLDHAPGTRNRKVIRLTEAGRYFGEQRVKWIFEAEQRAMEDTEPAEVMAYVSMLEKYIVRFRKEIEDKD
jgi:DNA-binding MarR family transcriptional regulator